MWKLKLQYFGHLMQRANSLEKNPMLGKTEKKGVAGNMARQHHQLNGHECEQTPGDSGGQRSLEGCSPLAHRVRYNRATERQTTEFPHL